MRLAGQPGFQWPMEFCMRREREREREREADCKADGLVMATRTRRGGLMARESQRPGERAPLWYAPRAGRVGYTKFRVGTVAPQ